MTATSQCPMMIKNVRHHSRNCPERRQTRDVQMFTSTCVLHDPARSCWKHIFDFFWRLFGSCLPNKVNARTFQSCHFCELRWRCFCVRVANSFGAQGQFATSPTATSRPQMLTSLKGTPTCETNEIKNATTVWYLTSQATVLRTAMCFGHGLSHEAYDPPIFFWQAHTTLKLRFQSWGTCVVDHNFSAIAT